MSLRPWDAASRPTVPAAERRRPELAALPSLLPTLAELFTFMRDAELRFERLRLRIEERTYNAAGENLTLIEALIQHHGHARVTTTHPGLGTKGNYEVWLSDGVTVRTYSGLSHVATNRPIRPRVRGLDDGDLPGTSTVYRPLTHLPAETLPETFVHPAGLCQNVLSTGDCRVEGTADQAGREVIVVECLHPRSIEVFADRPDHQLQVWVDRETGVISRLMETVADEVTRDAIVTSLEPDVTFAPHAFDFTFPSDARILF
jgi:hypothetical protein